MFPMTPQPTSKADFSSFFGRTKEIKLNVMSSTEISKKVAFL